MVYLIVIAICFTGKKDEYMVCSKLSVREHIIKNNIKRLLNLYYTIFLISYVYFCSVPSPSEVTAYVNRLSQLL